MTTQPINLRELREQVTALDIRHPDHAKILLDAPLVLSLIDVAEAAREIVEWFDCNCAEHWTGRNLHAPECLYEDGHDLRETLARFTTE